MTPARGRPRLPDDERLVKGTVTFAPATWAAVALAATLAGVSIAVWIRRVVIDALRREL